MYFVAQSALVFLACVMRRKPEYLIAGTHLTRLLPSFDPVTLAEKYKQTIFMRSAAVRGFLVGQPHAHTDYVSMVWSVFSDITVTESSVYISWWNPIEIVQAWGTAEVYANEQFFAMLSTDHSQVTLDMI